MGRQLVKHPNRAGEHAPHRAHQLHVVLIDQLIVQLAPVRPNAHHAADLVRVRPIEAVRQLVGNHAVPHHRKHALIAFARHIAAVRNRSIQIKDDERRVLCRAQISAAFLAAVHSRRFQPARPPLFFE